MTLKNTSEDPTVSAPRLSRASILAAGMEIASRPGSTSVTVRELGTALGVDPSAIYRHFHSKDALMAGLLDQVIELVNARQIIGPESWQEALYELSQNCLEIYLEYPSIATQAAILSTNGTAELRGIEFILQSLSNAGLEGDELVEHYVLFSSYMLSFGPIVAQSQLTATAEDSSDNGYVPETIAATAALFPATTRYREQLLALQMKDVYATGVRLIVENAARAAELRHG